jgi:hypothetical protein
VSPPNPTAPIDSIKKSVAFIQGNYKKPVVVDGVPQLENALPKLEDKESSVRGTGFFIVYPEERVGKDKGIVFLVTNKHMVREPGLDGTLGKGPYLKNIIVRLNTKSPVNGSDSYVASGLVSITNATGDLEVLVHPDDPDVDLALVPIGLDQNSLDFLSIPTSLFATKDILIKEQVDETSELLFAGLFASYLGDKKNYPIVRHGKLAMISPERVPWNSATTEDLYLADVMSFGGNSGSPVFLRLGGSTDRGLFTGIHYLLLGVMQGYFGVDSPISMGTAKINGKAIENTGVAAVVPAQKILDILQSPRGRAHIDRRVAGFYISSGRLEEAAALYRDLISRLSAFDPLHSDFRVAKLEYAELLKKMGKYVEASTQQREAAAIVRRGPIPDDLKK